MEGTDNEHVDYPIQSQIYETRIRELTKPTKSRDSDVHGPFPTPVITSDTEKGSTSRTEEEGEGDGGRDGGFGNFVVAGEGRDGQGDRVD